MAAKMVERLPEGKDWVYEVKLDGYRVLIVKNDEDVRLISRNNKDLTYEFPHVQRAAARLKARIALIDGEIVAVDEKGAPRFQLLQHRSTTNQAQIVYYAFDLLNLEGEDITSEPLEKRKAKLKKLVNRSGVLISEPLPGTLAQIVEAASNLQLEGIVAKRRDSRYQIGVRSNDWQ